MAEPGRQRRWVGRTTVVPRPIQGSGLVKGWKVGDRLEALDLHDTDHDLAYVATVSNIMEVIPPVPLALTSPGPGADPL